MAVAVHSSGNYLNETTSFFADYIGGQGQPLFFADRTNLGINRNNGAAKRQELLDIVQTAAGTNSAIGLSATASSDGTTLVVSVDYESLSADYRLGVYLLDNNLVGAQASRGNDAQHKRMLIGYMTTGVEGRELTGNSGNETFTAPLSAYDIVRESEFQVLVVAWDVSGSMAFANGRLLDIEDAVVSTTALQIDDFDYQVSGDQVTARWSGPSVTSATLTSLSGQSIAKESVYNNGVELSAPAASGVYVLTLFGAEGIYSEKVHIHR